MNIYSPRLNFVVEEDYSYEIDGRHFPRRKTVIPAEEVEALNELVKERLREPIITGDPSDPHRWRIVGVAGCSSRYGHQVAVFLECTSTCALRQRRVFSINPGDEILPFVEAVALTCRNLDVHPRCSQARQVELVSSIIDA